LTRSTDHTTKLHYAWIVAGVTFFVLLATAGIRATPAILMVPLEHEFGWTRAGIASAIAINIALFGLIGPFAASFIDRYGLRRMVLGALALLTAGVALSSTMHAQWQLTLFWGVLVGAGTGVTAMVLAAIVVNRWFDERRGLVLGMLSAANATGQLVFLPVLARLVTAHGWRSATYTVAAAAAIVFVVVLFLLRDKPSDLGLLPYGATNAVAASPQNVARTPVRALLWAARSRDFWILAGTFFICGASTNGLIGTHLIPACMDHGIPEVTAAGMLAAMGIFDLLGTTASAAAIFSSGITHCAASLCSFCPSLWAVSTSGSLALPCFMAWIGSPPFRPPSASRPTLLAAKTWAWFMAGSARRISWELPRRR
jgi:MFS family permease